MRNIPKITVFIFLFFNILVHAERHPAPVKLTKNDIKLQISKYAKRIKANIEGNNRFHVCFYNGAQYLYWLEHPTIFIVSRKKFASWHKEIIPFTKEMVVPLKEDMTGSTYLVDQEWFFTIAIICLKSKRRFSVLFDTISKDSN